MENSNYVPEIYIGENGNWFINSVDTGIKAQGEPGKDGVAPHISEDGFWCIGEMKTTVRAKGDTGVAGPQGPAGETGPRGFTGPAGPQGATGSQGVTGATGPQGLTGPQGMTGPKGNTGERGPQGDQGPQGIQGPVGPQGPANPNFEVETYGLISYNQAVISNISVSLKKMGRLAVVNGYFKTDAAIGKNTYFMHFHATMNPSSKVYFLISNPSSTVPGYGVIDTNGYVFCDNKFEAGYYFFNFTYLM